MAKRPHKSKLQVTELTIIWGPLVGISEAAEKSHFTWLRTIGLFPHTLLYFKIGFE
jgi:hypothetical protein